MKWPSCSLLLTVLLVMSSHAAQPTGCLPALPVPIRVSIAEAAIVDARLQASSSGLAVVAAADGRQLWSAAGSAPADQLFEPMQVAFAGSLMALDLDGDGLHDRIYAGDLASRLWRFDLHHGAPSSAWASGGMLADFSSAAGRAFVAAPDVSLSTSADGSWFNIAIGTASLPGSATGNRFYVVRDNAPFEAWTDADYARWVPLREGDLVRLANPASTPPPSMRHGYFIELTHGEVLMPSITVAGRAVLAIADSASSSATQCRVAVSVAVVDVASAVAPGKPSGGGTANAWRERLPVAVAATARFELAASSQGEAACTLDGQQIAACAVATRPVRTWWRRGDAE
ncbi:MAG: hypothetical protein ABW278_08915 [Steroidobacteraceae bacterium]